MRKWGIAALIVLAVGSLLAGFLNSGAHGPGHWWDSIPGFFIFFGFVGCALLIVFSKALGKAFLLKKEDYYNKMK
ncbi:MAG: hypothetical protein MUP70_10245 [Candidatus Aminicenantes bacterium]|nr:hypothetical protein [Candidatus Aminicenantes bacterium]